MRWSPVALATTLAVALVVGWASAADPPHDEARSIDCSACHTPHKAAGAAITTLAANLCQSCHVAGGTAGAKPFAESDQALPWPGLPAGASPAGTSHRWDSGPSGHVAADALNTSTGTVQSGGSFTGRYAKTYTLTITTAGDVGTAKFSWTDTRGGSATGLTAGAGIPLDEGITATFADGAATPSFTLNDRWRIYVRTDIALPTSAALLARVYGGKIACTTCHDQHSQAAEPFDPAAPAYGGRGTGAGRHFQRLANDTDQMCRECHAARNVTQAAQGSHPVGVAVPGTGAYKAPASLPLDKTTSQLQCTTCHTPHYAPATDGTLLRLANQTILCADCHTLADTTTPASHLSAATGVLWPGGQYGSTFPQVTDTARRGVCTNCHQPHGWPDAAAPAQDYPRLLVDREENLCYTCHDGAPVTKDIRSLFTKSFKHPIATAGIHSAAEAGDPSAYGASPANNRHAECADCHDPHQARSGYLSPATSSYRIGRVGRIKVTNGGAGSVPTYTYVPASDTTTTPVAEYQLCFKCHSSWTTLPASARDTAVEFNPANESAHPVEAAGKNTTAAMTNSLNGGTGSPKLTTSSTVWCSDCHNNEAIPTTVSTLSSYTGAVPRGPHGSNAGATDANLSAKILRGSYRGTLMPINTAYGSANFTLCFICHASAPFADTSGNTRSDTNFRFHGFHLANIRNNPGGGVAGNLDTPGNGTAGQGNAVCKECHYAIHSSKLTSHSTNRGYARLVSFSPSISGSGGTGAPSWSLTGKSCTLRCHGTAHTTYTY